MSELRRNNHFLSQMYLNSFSKDKKVYAYERLVSNENVPLFQRKSIRGIGSYNSMYVRLLDGEEVDDIEKWFGERYENPCKDSLLKAISGKKLDERDWHLLIEFLACHIVRSPKFIMQSIENAKKHFPAVNDNVLGDRELEKEDVIPFPVKAEIRGDSIYIETMIGKQAYLSSMMRMLNRSDVLHNHHWSIITVDPRVSLPTSDNPVVFLNYYDKNHYTLNGGWNSPGTNILFPISPQKLICCQIGDTYPEEIKADLDTSLFFKKVIAENSYKKVISREKDLDIPIIIPRIVNEELFLQEKNSWIDFQKNYLEKEKDYIK